jgi:hypothetical protein
MQLFEEIYLNGHDLKYFYNQALFESKKLSEKLVGKIQNNPNRWYKILRSGSDGKFSPIVGGPGAISHFETAFKWWYAQKNRSYSLVQVDLQENPLSPQPEKLNNLNKYCKLQWAGGPVKQFSLLPPKDVDIDVSSF